MPAVSIARKLRTNQTDAEKKLWSRIRNRQFHDLKFCRQHAIAHYVADFYCEELHLIIELDGGQHEPCKDRARKENLEGLNYFIVRYWNNEILENMEGVLADMVTYIDRA